MQSAEPSKSLATKVFRIAVCIIVGSVFTKIVFVILLMAGEAAVPPDSGSLEILLVVVVLIISVICGLASFVYVNRRLRAMLDGHIP